MRCPSRTLLASCALALVLGSIAPTGAGAEELPPGFTDGQPVGQVEAGDAQAPATDGSGGQVEAAAVTVRYFGGEAFAAVRAAAAATTRGCSISDDGLTAMVLAPVFKESSAATTPSSAPSPMTLSRYDEWNGVTSTSLGTPENNYGLYAFRNPSTPYKRAFWHPGLGIWQFDTAGLGAPLTTIEAMDVRIVAAKVAEIIAGRYCSATGSNQDRRFEAWRAWGFPCTLCDKFFLEMAGTTPPFANLELVPGISPLGGVVKRTCSVQGISGTIPCWYVNPVVGQIEGATAWATLPPLDGGPPTVAPTPLSTAFYVIDRGATEERHWLRADTGYSIDIRASRTIGRDARPRSTQSGSGLTWSSSSTLCDLTEARGMCTPVPPPSKRAVLQQVADTFTPIALDLDGTGVDDVVWYGPGSARDAFWLGNPSGSFSAGSIDVTGTYQPFTGDFDGDGKHDLFWYAPGSPADPIWYGASPYTARATVPTSVSGTYTPLVGDFNGDERDDVVWYAPGSPPDSIWYGRSDRTFHKVARPVSGTYTPVVGDFNGSGRDDIFWYRPGAGSHPVWYGGTSAGSFTASSATVAGSHSVFGGDFDGDGRDDVFFYAPGAAGDTVLFGGSGTSFATVATPVQGTYLPVVADLQGDGRTDIVWYSATGADSVWLGQASRSFGSASTSIPFAYQPVVGQFDDGPGDDIIWYEPGTEHGEAVWLDP